MRHSQAIVSEDVVPAGGLRRAVWLQIPPGGDGRLVPPEGEGKEFARLGQALEALDGDEAIDLLQ
jgi:hypothetical protein